MRYWNLIRNHHRVLAFGFIHAFCSAPGQTFCIALFVASFAATFQASAAELGSLYLIATLAAAIALSQIGAWIDRISLRTYCIAASLLLAFACLLTASAPNLTVLAIGLFALRLAGQGLMMHIQATATVRAFADGRGTALGLTGLGTPIAAAIFPAISVSLIAVMGWRWAYAAIGAGVFALLLPLLIWFVPAAADIHRVRESDEKSERDGVEAHIKPFAASRTLMSSSYFWAAVPMLLLVPFVSTAIVFQLTVIAADRGWTPAWVAGGFPVLALAHVVSMFASGQAIDAYSARTVAILHAIPITVSVLLLATFEQPVVLMVAMFGLGLSGGAAQTAFSAIWAEIYGTRHFGAIRSVVMSLMVVASAVAPLALGLALSGAANISSALMALAGVAVALQLPLLGVEATRGNARRRGG